MSSEDDLIIRTVSQRAKERLSCSREESDFQFFTAFDNEFALTFFKKVAPWSS